MDDDITPNPGLAEAAKSTGENRPDVSQLPSFQNGGSGRAPSPDAGNAKPGTPKIGRPSKADLAKREAAKSGSKTLPPPLPKAKRVDDEDINRENFELLLTELLIATTDEWSSDRYQLLLRVCPADTARLLADKIKLTDTEKRIFGKLVGRLYEKYVGSGFEYTDEMMLVATTISYILRNREGGRLVKEALKINAAQADQRSKLQGQQGGGSGNDGHGQVNTGG